MDDHNDKTLTGPAGFTLLGELPDEVAAPRLPTTQQVAAAMAMLALVGPAMLGGMPVIPVTMDEQRRRQQVEITQESESTVGVHQDIAAAAAALALSQGRLAQATRDVSHITTHDVSEADVVAAAHRVMAGEASPHQSARFRSALTNVAIDSTDLYILRSDEERVERKERGVDLWEVDPDAWLAEFE